MVGGSAGGSVVYNYLYLCFEQFLCLPEICVVDSFVVTSFGGTKQKNVNWSENTRFFHAVHVLYTTSLLWWRQTRFNCWWALGRPARSRFTSRVLISTFVAHEQVFAEKQVFAPGETHVCSYILHLIDSDSA